MKISANSCRPESLWSTPISSCGNAQGIAQTAAMLVNNVNVALGTESAASCDSFDLFREMHLAGMVHKGPVGRVDNISSEQVLEMATINGARALGLEEEIGSLEVGKKAAFVAITPFEPNGAPCDRDQLCSGGINPVATVVYSCIGGDVSKVVINDHLLMDDGKLLLDDDAIINNARWDIEGILSHSQARPLKSL